MGMRCRNNGELARQQVLQTACVSYVPFNFDFKTNTLAGCAATTERDLLQLSLLAAVTLNTMGLSPFSSPVKKIPAQGKYTILYTREEKTYHIVKYFRLWLTKGFPK